MAKFYKCSKSKILSYAKDIGYKNEYSGILNDKQKEEIVKQYENKTSTELAEHYGVNRGQITKIWHDNNLIGKDRHKYPFDYNYFENINTPDKAYFLGFLAADGNVFKRDKGKNQAIIKLSLQKSDKNILEVFKIYLDSQQPLYITETINNNYVNYMYTLELVSDKMAQDLQKYNIAPNKTYNYSIINLNKDLMPHFFRGYFDGDGSISCSNNNLHNPSSYSIRISGFEHNLSKMKTYLLENEGINSNFIQDKRNKNLSFGALVFNNIEEKYMFLNYIYNDRRDIFLSRKRYLAECFNNAIQNNYSNRQNLYNNILMPSWMKPTSKSKIMSEKENWKALKC
ncbi:MAG: hypothetical protein IJA32_11675 [Lachnospiraceae bacterium]|nr:hypothetical protein [Lachnospiraceae bacterium]